MGSSGGVRSVAEPPDRAAGFLAPSAGFFAPAEVRLGSADGFFDPADGCLASADGCLASADGCFGAADGRLGAADGCLGSAEVGRGPAWRVALPLAGGRVRTAGSSVASSHTSPAGWGAASRDGVVVSCGRPGRP